MLMIAMPWLASCHQDEGPFKVGINRWLGYEAFYLAEQLSLYPRVEIVRLFSTLDVLRALRNGNLQGAGLTLDETLTLVDEGIDLQIVAVIDYSNGADVVMAGPEVASLAELRGKRIAVEINALGAMLLHGVLGKAGVNTDDVTIASMPVSQMARACAEKNIDAAVSYQPFASELSSCGMRMLFSSADIPGQIVDVLAVRRDALHRDDALRELINGYYKALNFIHEKPAQAQQRMADDLGISPQNVQQELDGLHLITREESLVMMQPSGDLAHTLSVLHSLMKSRGMVRNDIDVSRLIDTRWVAGEVP